MSTARGTLALTALLIAALPLGAEDTGDRKTALTHTLVPGVRCDELWNRNWPRTLHDKHITGLEACSAFTCVTACLLATSPYAMLSIRGFDGFVASTVAPIATGWSDQLPGGTCTH